MFSCVNSSSAIAASIGCKNWHTTACTETDEDNRTFIKGLAIYRQTTVTDAVTTAGMFLYYIKGSETVHRHVFWRQFTDKIGDSSPTDLKTVHGQKYQMTVRIMFFFFILGEKFKENKRNDSSLKFYS